MTLPGPGSLALLLRQAREAEGLSRRQLATRMGVSWVTVWEAERGRDVRHGTLQAFVTALPGLDPAAVLGVADRALPQPSPATWQLIRDAFGYEAASLLHEVTISPDGDVEQVVRVEGLTTTRGDLREPGLRATLACSIFLGSREARARITAEALGKAGRRLTVVDGPATHEVIIAGRGGRSTLRYEMREHRPGLFSREAVEPAVSSDGAPVVHGTAQVVMFPVQELRLAVRSPVGRRPKSPSAHAWPRSLAPDVHDADLLRALHPAARLDQDADTGHLELAIDRPLVELYYGLGWEAP